MTWSSYSRGPVILREENGSVNIVCKKHVMDFPPALSHQDVVILLAVYFILISWNLCDFGEFLGLLQRVLGHLTVAWCHLSLKLCWKTWCGHSTWGFKLLLDVEAYSERYVVVQMIGRCKRHVNCKSEVVLSFAIFHYWHKAQAAFAATLLLC